jgi:hypothetical protein
LLRTCGEINNKLSAVVAECVLTSELSDPSANTSTFSLFSSGTLGRKAVSNETFAGRKSRVVCRLRIIFHRSIQFAPLIVASYETTFGWNVRWSNISSGLRVRLPVPSLVHHSNVFSVLMHMGRLSCWGKFPNALISSLGEKANQNPLESSQI